MLKKRKSRTVVGDYSTFNEENWLLYEITSKMHLSGWELATNESPNVASQGVPMRLHLLVLHPFSSRALLRALIALYRTDVYYGLKR
jgi:hypothetical protein